jgi:protein-tyrosine-phosphatase
MAATGLILTVCTANICRSPMAAALLRHALAAEPEPLHSLEVASAGIAARSGQPVSANSVSTLRKAGIDIADHRSQPVTQALLDRALLVLCMTESHRAMIALSFRPVPPRLHLFREFMPRSAEKEIGDPFGGPLSAYEAARDEMVEAIPSLLAFIRRNFAGKTGA